MYNCFKLSNNLRVVIENIDYVHSVSVGLWIENGSRNENEGNNGISHFIEHMLFKGTSNRTAKEIAESIEDVGGQINAFTGKEATCFYVKVLDTHLELALDILADILFNSKFSEEDIEKEKGVVKEEINMSEDTPEDVLTDLHSKAIWGDDPISLPILGTDKTVKSITRERILEYLSCYYIPENSVISIAGKFDTSTIEKTVCDYFGKWHSDNKKITKYSSPLIQNEHLFRNKKIEQLHINLGLYGIETGSDDIYALLILNNIFGGGASSILFQKIREELGICYSIYSYISSFNNTGVLSIYSGLNPSYSSEAVLMIKEEITKFVKSGISNEKLIKAKEQLKGNYILGLESTSSRMFSNGKSVMFLNKVNTPNDIINKINSVNLDKINDVMKYTFGKGILNSAFVGDTVNLDTLKNILEGDIIAFENKKATQI